MSTGEELRDAAREQAEIVDGHANSEQMRDLQKVGAMSDKDSFAWSGDEIKHRFIGAIGGPEWLAGPTSAAAVARDYVKCLDAVLAGLALPNIVGDMFTNMDSGPMQNLDGEFRPTPLLIGKMRRALIEEFGADAVDMFDVGELGTDTAKKYADKGAFEPMLAEADRISLPVDPRLIQTESADFIVNNVLPHALAQFLSKNADYGDQHRTGLGIRAEFVGLHRKMAKLQKAIWDGETMNHEGAEEMLTDVWGQVLLMLDLIRQSES